MNSNNNPINQKTPYTNRLLKAVICALIYKVWLPKENACAQEENKVLQFLIKESQTIIENGVTLSKTWNYCHVPSGINKRMEERIENAKLLSKSWRF